MKIKKFKAKTFGEALEQVKRELSKDAVILSTEEKKGVRPYVEVTAAVDYDSALSPAPYGQAAGESNRRGYSRIISDTAPLVEEQPTALSVAARDEIRSELNQLREAIEAMRESGFEIALPMKKKKLLHFLRERAVRDEFALRICERANDVQDLLPLLTADIRVTEKTFSRKAVMLIGPTGVGKTTTIAKLAAHAIRLGKKTAVINLDTYRIGALEQMRIYTRIMGIPLAVVSSPEELVKNLAGFSKTRDIVFIDTTGRNPRDEEYINDILRTSCLASDDGTLSSLPFELHLLMSANADDDFLIDAYHSYRKLPIDSIAFTKIDEAVRFGSLYNILLTYQKPVAYVTTGQAVPGDIEFAGPERIAGLILTKGTSRC